MRARTLDAAYWATFDANACTGVGHGEVGSNVSVQHGQTLVQWATAAEREADARVAEWRHSRAVEWMLLKADATKSAQAYSAKEAESRAWLAIHPTEDGATPDADTYLHDEMTVCSCTAHEAATAIVAAANVVRLQELERREQTLRARALRQP